MDEKEMEYELEYTVAMAESELYNSILMTVAGSILESNNEVLLNEGMRETILSYIDKVSQGIQKAWTRLKEAVDDKQKEFVDKTIKPLIDKIPNDLSYKIENFKEYDLTKFNSIKLAKYDYELMKEFCETQKDFIDKFYPTVAANMEGEEANIKQAVDKALGGKVIKSQDVDKNFLVEQFNFLTKGYFEVKDNINEDIETVNASNQTIAATANQEKVEEIAKFYLETCMEIMNEDGESGEGEGETKVSDNNEEQAPSDATPEEKKKFESRTAVKVVLMYFKTGTAILTAKMSALNKARKNALIVVNYYAKGKIKELGNKKKEGGEEKVPEAPQEIK